MRRLHFRRPIIGRLTIGLSVAAALALMSFGWSGLAGLTAHPARLGVVATLVSAGCVFLLRPCQLFAGGRREVRRQRFATFAAIGLMGGLCWLLPYADRHDWMVWPENPLLRYAGLVGAVVGTGVRIAGMLALGPLFSGFVRLHEAHELVTTGWYRWVRHPIYSASIVGLAGICLVFRSQLVVVLVPLYVAGTLWRIADEERMLTHAFGGAYRRYQQRTWRLVPFVY